MQTLMRVVLGTLAATVLIAASPAHQHSIPARGEQSPPPNPGRDVAIPGGGIVRTWNAPGEDGSIRPHFAISLDGQEWDIIRETSYELLLRYAHFDPVDAVPGVPLQLRASEDAATERGAIEREHVYIAQFITQPLEGYRQAIRDLGGTVRSFIANHAHLVRMTDAQRRQVEALPFVRWVGSYEPAYRVEEFILDHLDEADAFYPRQRYNIMLFESSKAAKGAVADRIAAIGGAIDSRDAGKYLIEATLTPQQLFEVASWNEVLFIDRWSPVGLDMDVARQISGADYIEGVGGFTGAGVRGEVIDVGFNALHGDFASRPFVEHTTFDDDSHGASTSGIIFGDGTGNTQGRGLLPDGQGIVADWDIVTSRYTHTGELVQSPYFAVLQSASVGSAQTVHYTTISADTDAALFDFDILHCQSQSNEFTQASRPQAWSKNIVSVGGIRHFNTLTKSDDCWGCASTAASIGPAEDGRLKPDLCHFYDNIFTVTSGGPAQYTSSFGGTSGATPIVAGHFGLFFQMWNEGIFGNAVDPLATVFENRPHMTTAKAMLINTAAQYAFAGADHDLTRTHQGWGMPDLQALYDLRTRMMVIDESDTIEALQTNYYTVTVAPDEPAAGFTLVYADPPGVPASTQARINDLSLRVTSPGGDVYWGNVGLRDGNWSQTGGSRNTVDTVENVFVQNPTPGEWQIEVLADEINQDGHTETGALDADYALVASGVVASMPPLVIALPDGLPGLIAPDQATNIAVRIIDGSESYVPGTGEMLYRFDPADGFTSIPLTSEGAFDFSVVLPGPPCGSTPEFYFRAEGSGGGSVAMPALGDGGPFGVGVGQIQTLFEDDFEADLGWTIEDDPLLTAGSWDRGVPVGLGERGDPPTDFDGSGACQLTENVLGNSDVDAGYTRLISPAFDLSSGDATVRFALWYDNTWGADPLNDTFRVDISNDGGANWILAQEFGPQAAPGWSQRSFVVSSVIAPTANMRLRFEASDLGDGSVVEAAIDAVRVDRIICIGPCPADLTGDGVVNVLDLLQMLGAWGPNPGHAADLNGDDVVNVLDLLQMLGAWGSC